MQSEAATMYKRSSLGVRQRNVRTTSLSSQKSTSVSSSSSTKGIGQKDGFSKVTEKSDILDELDQSTKENEALESRAISQRTPKNKKFQPRKPRTYFEEIMVKCGLLLDESEDNYILGKSQALFVKELENELKKNISYPRNIDEFTVGFEKFVSSSKDFKKALSYTKTSDDCSMARSLQQVSLVRLLLLTTNLQTKISKLILEKAAEYALSSVDDMGNDLDEAGWVRLVLSQLRSLDRVVDGESLANKLIEILEAAPLPVKQEVIFFMPQIISYDQHQDVAECLSKMLHENFSLTPSVLDALSQLNIGSILRAKVCEEMLDALRKAPVEFLPSIVGYVLSESDLDDLELVTTRLRVVLDLTSRPSSSSLGTSLSQRITQIPSTSQGGGGSKSSQNSYVILTLEAIAMRLKVGLRGLRLVDAWLNSLEAVKSADDHKPLDLLTIIVILDVGNGAFDQSQEKSRHRKVKALLKTKIKEGLITEELLEKTFLTHAIALREYFKTVVYISSKLLSCREETLLMHGAVWLRLSFVHLAEHLRPIVLGEIIMHTAVGKMDTAKVMLKTLHCLSHEHYEKIGPHCILLLGLLEKFEDMDMELVHNLMDILCFIGFAKDDHGSSLRSDITILIRKHLSSSNSQLKRKGVIAATVAVKHIASIESECDMVVRGPSFPNTRASSTGSQGSEDSLIPGTKAANAVMFIELVLSTCGCDAEVIGLLYDQLSSMALDAELDEKFMEWISKTMAFDFQDSFIEESNSNFEAFADLPLSIQFALDEDLLNPIALKLTPLVAQREERQGGPRVSFGGQSSNEKVERPLEVMNPLIRLVRILRFRLEEGDLSSIDALLGCGVVLPRILQECDSNNLNITEEFAAIGCLEQRTFLSSVIYAINWFIELINAFTFQKDQQLRNKVIKRVMTVVELREVLADCLPQLPGYIPPPSQYLCPNSVPTFTAVVKEGKKSNKKRRRKRGVPNKKSKKQMALTAQDPDEVESGGEDKDEEVEEDDVEEEKQKEGAPSKIQRKEQTLSLMAPFFRELDVEVFILLREDLVIDQHSTQNNRQRPPQLGPAELKFLLEDYTMKLEHSLPGKPLITSSSNGIGTGSSNRIPAFLSSSAKKNSIFLNLDLHESKDVALSAISLLPSICEKVERVSEYFRDAIVEFDGVLDNPQMFLGHSPTLARCFHLLLKDLGIILSWNGYSSMGAAGTRLLKEALSVTGGRIGALARSSQATQSNLNILHLAEESCSYFARFVEWVVRLPTAVALVSLIHRTTLLAGSGVNQRQELATACRTFLSREWIGVDGLPEIGTRSTDPLGLIMTSFLWALCSEKRSEEWESTGSPLMALHRIINEVEGSASDLTSNQDRLTAFPAITKATFHVVYQSLATWLVCVVRDEIISPPPRKNQVGNTQMRATQGMASQVVASQRPVPPSVEMKLDWWEIAVKCLHSLVKISKIQESRRNLSTLLKKAQPLINTFLSNAMPVLDNSLCTHPKKVYAILRDLQNSTRFLQHLCCDCKVKQDVGLINHVPAMKRVLEQLVVRVKDMLLKNNCAVAFWVGNLKNKNLRGEEIVSQAVSRSASLRDEEESEEQLNANDDDANAEDANAEDANAEDEELASEDSDHSVTTPVRKSLSKRKLESDDDSDPVSDED